MGAIGVALVMAFLLNFIHNRKKKNDRKAQQDMLMTVSGPVGSRGSSSSSSSGSRKRRKNLQSEDIKLYMKERKDKLKRRILFAKISARAKIVIATYQVFF